jgi:ADP-ribose pyrophosphatase YjhB (NUDIX family)
VLLLRRATPGAPATWCLPGGKVDYGETVEAAAARELAEETALRLNRCRFLFFQDSLPFEPGGMHCINFYLACEAAGEVVLNAESAGHAWIGSSDLATYNIVFRNDVGLKRFWEETS